MERYSSTPFTVTIITRASLAPSSGLRTQTGPDCPGVTRGLSFLEEHLAVDVGHTQFNARELDKLTRLNPRFVAPLAGGRLERSRSLRGVPG